jgi:hypothetical protein
VGGSEEANEGEREKLLGEGREGSKGVLQTAIGIAQLAAGDREPGQGVEGVGEGAESILLEQGVVVEEKDEVG